MTSTAKSNNRPEPTPLLRILRQVEDLPYGEFIALCEILEIQPHELHNLVKSGIVSEREKGETA